MKVKKQNKRQKKKQKKKQRKKINIVDLLLFLLFVILTVFFIVNLVRLSNIENLIRFIVIIILVLVMGLILKFYKAKKLICRIIMILLVLIYSFINYAFYRIYSSLDNITTKVDTKIICLVTSLEDVTDISDMTDSEIGIIDSSMDSVIKEFALDVVNNEGLDNSLVEYNDYLQMINDLLNNELDYAFLPENYNDIYNASKGGEDETELDFTVLYKDEKVIQNNDVADLKNIDEPFTMLLMGTDVILDSYNADTLLLLTVNPKTMRVTMLSIPRDTYTVIACTGGKHKINSSGWYGDSCVVKTVEKYMDIDIDYYAKINFFGIVDLVDKLGGIEVDVPYAFCEQNSERKFGSSTLYVDAGLQTLNGEEALALSRNRHYWTGMCPSKYTTDGDRSDLTRGKNQQLVIKAILNKLMTVRDLNQFYDILDTIGDNMVTNMSRDTILSFYNVGKEVIKRLGSDSVDDVINIDRLSVQSYSSRILISGLELSMIINYEESVDYVSNEMKKNLGLVEREEIKDFSFDINEEYNPDNVDYDSLSGSVDLLPSFVGKTVDEALSYCNRNNLKCEVSSGATSGTITTQSIGAKTDVSTIRNKTITFGVEKAVVDDKPEIDNDSNSGDYDIIDMLPSDDTEDNEQDNSNQNNNEETDSDNSDNSTSGTSTPDQSSTQTPPANDNTTKEEEGSVSGE